MLESNEELTNKLLEKAKSMRPLLIRNAYYYTRDIHKAEDVYQETLLNLWKKAHLYKGRGSMSNWIKIINKREGIRYFKRKILPNLCEISEGFLEDDKKIMTLVIDPRYNSPLEDNIEDESIELLRGSVEKLSDELRRPIQLKIYEDKSYKYMASIFGITREAIRLRIERALLLLSEIAKKCEIFEEPSITLGQEQKQFKRRSYGYDKNYGEWDGSWDNIVRNLEGN